MRKTAEASASEYAMGVAISEKTPKSQTDRAVSFSGEELADVGGGFNLVSGEDFPVGLLLYDGFAGVEFGEQLHAVSIGQLWQCTVTR